MVDWPNPQNTAYTDAPGAYSLALRTSKSEIDPGDDVVIEIHITGYGKIRGPKVTFYPPPDSVTHPSLGGWVVGSAEWKVGNFMFLTRGLQGHDTLIVTIGMDEETWAEHPAFVDHIPTDEDVSAIAAEYTRGNKPPITMTWATKGRRPTFVPNWRYLGKLQVTGAQIRRSIRIFTKRVLRKELRPDEKKFLLDSTGFRSFLRISMGMNGKQRGT